VAEALSAQAPQVSELVGVDISGPMLARAARRLPGRVLRASALQLPFGAEQFASVIAVHVLHLVPDLLAIVAEAARVLGPGGRLVAVHGTPEIRSGRRPDRGHQGTRPARRGAARLAPDRAGGGGCGRSAMPPAASGLSARHGAHPGGPGGPRRGALVVDGVEPRRDPVGAEVEPVIAALRALPGQDRPRRREVRRTLSVFERSHD
jgi:SAM-dependent methyltransferase